MTARIKIAHLTTVHPRRDIRIFRKECLSLVQLGYEVHLFVADGLGNEDTEGVSIHDVGPSRGRLRRVLFHPWIMWRSARRLRAAVYHFHDPELLPVGLVLRMQGAKVVYDAHEDVPRAVMSKFWIPPALRKLISVSFEILENFIAARVSAVTAATPHIARRFLAHQQRSIEINNFPLEGELTSPTDSPTEARTVCYVGGIGLIRGAVEMIQAIDMLDARLILAGSFESDSSERLIRALPGWRKVDYRGLVSREEVRRIFAQSRAGLLFFHPEPNHVDAQPNKMFEYMSAGLPVLASNFPIWGELLADTGAGICADPLNPRAIASTIESVLSDPEGAKAMGQRGRDAVTTRYQWRFEEQKLAALYADLIVSKP